jgi:predicted P-loop ATPase
MLGSTAEFVARFFAQTKYAVELRALPSKARRFTRKPDEVEQFIKEQGRENLFFGVATRHGGGTKENCQEVPAFWADVDFKKTPEAQARELLNSFPFRPSLLIESGGGLHLYWVLIETAVASDPRVAPILRGLANRLGADPAAAEVARIMRLPGTTNYKYDPPRECRLAEERWHLRYRLGDFEPFATGSGRNPASHCDHDARIAEGGRNTYLTSVAGAMRRRGCSVTAIEAALLEENQHRCKPPLPESEVRGIATSIGRYKPSFINGADSFHSAHMAARHTDNSEYSAEMSEMGRDENWKSHLIVGRYGAPKPILANAITAFRSAPEWTGVVAFNDFSIGTVMLKAAPWSGAKAGESWTDHEDRLAADWLQRTDIIVPVEIAGQAVQVVAKDLCFHPVREYLNSLTWDGKPRIGRWLTDYLAVEQSDYASAVGARWLISAVARIFQPGCKADCCLILEGPQGILKSTTLRTIAGDWFTDEIAELGSKDAALQTRGVWIIEIAELDSMSKTEVSRIKSFMSRTTDRFRPPYGKRLIESPRQCVFAGSVNHYTYMRDETGGRRFWPVACQKIFIDDLARDRDQLWAEAVTRYYDGAPWWLDSRELNQAAEQQQDDRYDGDPWQELIADYLERQHNTSITQILACCIEKKKDQWTKLDKNRVGSCLRVLKWETYQDRDGEKREWRWRRRS